MQLDLTSHIGEYSYLPSFIFYPSMGALVLFMAFPFWTFYIFFSILNFRLNQALGDKFSVIKHVEVFIHTVLDGLFNPVALPVYNALVAYYFSNYLSWFYYTNSLNQPSHRPLIYFVSVVIGYALWNYYSCKVIKFFFPLSRYESNFKPKMLSVSRIFGSCVAMIVIFDFDPVIEDLLQWNVNVGCFLAVTSYIYSVYRLSLEK